MVERVDDLEAGVVAHARAALDSLGPADDGAGRVAVIAAPGRLEAVRDALARSTVADALVAGSFLDARLAVLAPRAAKGLEFDVVVLAEPTEVAREGGAGDLYVAMTRPTRALHVVTVGDLPDGLAASADAGQPSQAT